MFRVIICDCFIRYLSCCWICCMIWLKCWFSVDRDELLIMSSFCEDVLFVVWEDEDLVVVIVCCLCWRIWILFFVSFSCVLGMVFVDGCCDDDDMVVEVSLRDWWLVDFFCCFSCVVVVFSIVLDIFLCFCFVVWRGIFFWLVLISNWCFFGVLGFFRGWCNLYINCFVVYNSVLMVYCLI